MVTTAGVRASGKITLVGQAPSRDADGSGAFTGRSGRRLAELSGLSHADFLERFELTNLLDRWPGRRGKGDAFPTADARKAAASIVLPSRSVLVGRAVAAAFGLRRLTPCRWTSRGDGLVAMIPHPSGVNLWWNDRENRELAGAFMRGLAAQAAEGPNAPAYSAR